MEGGEDVVLKPPIAGGGPWSSFHSLKLPVARLPGGPVRQYQTPSLALPVDLATTSAPRATNLVEEIKQYFTDLDLLIEYKLLYLNRCPGVYVIPSSKSLHEWHGVIFVRSGPFRSGIFRFTLYIPDGFPQLRPMVKFHSKVFHPYVHAENGVLNLLRGFPPWEPSKHHIFHVVKFVADCFYLEETWDGEEKEVFVDQARTCVRDSLKNIHDPNNNEGGNSICFKEMDDLSFQDALLTMCKAELPQPPKRPTLLSSVTDHVKQWWDFIT